MPYAMLFRDFKVVLPQRNPVYRRAVYHKFRAVQDIAAFGCALDFHACPCDFVHLDGEIIHSSEAALVDID
jgi:hypothetical protein